MKNSSIKFKIVLVVVICLVMGLSTTFFSIYTSYKENIDMIAQKSVTTSFREFHNLEKNDVDKLSSTLESLMINSLFQDLFIERDKEGLFNAASPLFEKLKSDYGITHWYFINDKDDGTCFLRVHNFSKSGDKITRYTYENAIKNGGFASGKELGKTAFALRVVHPYRKDGKIIGYMEVGEEIDHFFKIMKKQTGDEYGLLIDKKYLDEKKWASVQKVKGNQNNWTDFEDKLLIDSTSTDKELIRYDGDIARVSDDGEVLSEIEKDGKMYVRGVFPLYDAGNRKVGGVLVLHNVSDVYASMMAIQRNVLLTVFSTLFIICIVILVLFNRLVITRLNKILTVVTRVVGGDFYTKIEATSNDEIGQFEILFEKFRKVFVNTLNEHEETANTENIEKKADK